MITYVIWPLSTDSMMHSMNETVPVNTDLFGLNPCCVSSIRLNFSGYAISWLLKMVSYILDMTG